MNPLKVDESTSKKMIPSAKTPDPKISSRQSNPMPSPALTTDPKNLDGSAVKKSVSSKSSTSDKSAKSTSRSAKAQVPEQPQIGETLTSSKLQFRPTAEAKVSRRDNESAHSPEESPRKKPKKEPAEESKDSSDYYSAEEGRTGSGHAVTKSNETAVAKKTGTALAKKAELTVTKRSKPTLAKNSDASVGMEPGSDLNPRSTRSEKAGLIFPVGRVSARLRDHINTRLTCHAPIYLTGVLEYLTREVMKQAGEEAKKRKDALRGHQMKDQAVDKKKVQPIDLKETKTVDKMRKNEPAGDMKKDQADDKKETKTVDKKRTTEPIGDKRKDQPADKKETKAVENRKAQPIGDEVKDHVPDKMTVPAASPANLNSRKAAKAADKKKDEGVIQQKVLAVEKNDTEAIDKKETESGLDEKATQAPIANRNDRGSRNRSTESDSESSSESSSSCRSITPPSVRTRPRSPSAGPNTGSTIRGRPRFRSTFIKADSNPMVAATRSNATKRPRSCSVEARYGFRNSSTDSSDSSGSESSGSASSGSDSSGSDSDSSSLYSSRDRRPINNNKIRPLRLDT